MMQEVDYEGFGARHELMNLCNIQTIKRADLRIGSLLRFHQEGTAPS